MARRYPLQPLVGIRRESVERGAEAVAQAEARKQKAEAAANAVRGERSATAAAADGVRRDERAELEQGALRASDLQQAVRFDAGVSARLAEIGLRERAAAERVREAEAEKGRATSALAVARAEQKLVERHRQRFDESEARAANEREEEAALERWSARKRGETET